MGNHLKSPLSQYKHKQEIKGNYYFKFTFQVKLAKIITQNRKSKEIVTSKLLLSQNKQQSLL